VSGNRVRDEVCKSLGKCYIQQLTIEGSVNLCGVELSQDSFKDYFARLLLENWAIFHAERFENLRPLNRQIVTGINQDMKDFVGPAIGNIMGPGRRGRGGLETLL